MRYKGKYTLTDDVMFGRVMEDNDLCRRFLSVLLQRDVGVLFSVEREKSLHETKDGKPIRLDILAKSESGTLFDGEMQNLGKKSVRSLYLPQRTRYYQGMIDMNLIKEGKKYKDLPEANIVFICMFDPFGMDCPIYSFTDMCIEQEDLCLETRANKIFINVMCTKEIPADMRSIFEYLKSGVLSDGLVEDLENAVRSIESNEGWRLDEMKELLIAEDSYDDGYDAGLEKGREETREKLLMELVKLQAEGFSFDEALEKMKKKK